MFVDHSSAGELDISMASINRTGKSNAAKGVENHYNEYSEFHLRETEGHVVASFMEIMGMKNMEGSIYYTLFFLKKCESFQYNFKQKIISSYENLLSLRIMQQTDFLTF